MSRGDRQYQHRGCGIGTDVTVTGTPTPILVPGEVEGLLIHWRRMAMLTLENEPLDLPKLSYCVERLKFWQQHLEITN